MSNKIIATFTPILVLAVGSTFISYLTRVKGTTRLEWLTGLIHELMPEFWSAFITAVIFTFIVGLAEQQQNLEEKLSILVLAARSRVNDEAVRAVEEIGGRGWLKGVEGIVRGADLREANLQGARLGDAKLASADLALANIAPSFAVARLGDANLAGAKFDENTILPNSTFSEYNKWTPDTDMTRFTDPNHPDFWRSDDPESPAYRGEDDGS